MFCKGDKIVYPMYGAGIIEDLEVKEIDGIPQTYYVLNIPVGNLTIMVSSTKATSLGIREVYSRDKVLSVLKEVSAIPIDMPENWNERYKFNLEKIKTGNLGEVVEVYRNLFLREKEKGLSGIEKKLLSTAKQIILSEFVISHNINKDYAENILSDFMSDFKAVTNA